MAAKKKFTSEQSALLETLQARFEKNICRHKGIEWPKVLARLETASAAKWKALSAMEESDGEPDVVGEEEGEFIFYDCSAESPKGRRGVCYDDQAIESRKENKPKASAVGLASEMGVNILSEEEYRDLQKLGNFDSKTSSWLKTPSNVRKLGGALFGDYRYGTVFLYHNGAESYYAARGFRSSLKV